MQLYSYQKQAIEWLHKNNGNGVLWLDPGLGKTLTALTFCKEIVAKKVLVICPASLKQQWFDEIFKWYPDIKTQIIGGGPKEREKQRSVFANVFIINYELLLRTEDATFLFENGWDVIIVDESHRINNARAKTVKRLKKLQTNHKLALSGTQLLNKEYEIFSVIDWLSPNYLASNWWSFRANYCIMNPHVPGHIVGIRDLEGLKKRCAPFIFRKKREDAGVELPEKIIQTIRYDLNDKEKRAYKSLKEQSILEIEKDEFLTLPNALVKLLRLRQLVCSPRLIGLDRVESSKTKVILDLLDSLGDQRVLIFTEFAEFTEILNSIIPNSKIIRGYTELGDRNEFINEFKKGDIRVLIGTSAMSYGYNLQEADCVIHADQCFNFARMDQRESRAHRIGRRDPVLVYHLIAKDTVEEKLLKLIEQKNKDIENFLKTQEVLNIL